MFFWTRCRASLWAEQPRRCGRRARTRAPLGGTAKTGWLVLNNLWILNLHADLAGTWTDAGILSVACVRPLPSGSGACPSRGEGGWGGVTRSLSH